MTGALDLGGRLSVGSEAVVGSSLSVGADSYLTNLHAWDTCIRGASYDPQYALNVDGDVRGRGFFQYSDARVKRHIESIDAKTAFDRVMRIDVRTFNLMDESRKKTGVIAQELERVFPDLVTSGRHTIGADTPAVAISSTTLRFAQPVCVDVDDQLGLVLADGTLACEPLRATVTSLAPDMRASEHAVYECTCADASFAVGMRYRMMDLTVEDMRSVDYLQMIGHVVAAFQHFVHECAMV